MTYLSVFLFLLCCSMAEDIQLQEFIRGNLLVTSDIYQQIIKNNTDSFMVGIFPLEVALAFVGSGCKGSTAEEIQISFRFPPNAKSIEGSIKKYISSMVSQSSYIFDISSKIYVSDNFTIQPKPKKKASDVFFAQVENIDFTNGSEAAKTINLWVESNTHNKIHGVVDSQDFNNQTKAVVTSGAYFKANWSVAFMAMNTRTSPFYKSLDEVVQVNMMHQQAFYNYSENSQLNAKILEVPLVEGALFLVLPNSREGVPELEDQLQDVFVAGNLSLEFVSVQLPKFLISTRLKLKGVLQQLGITECFNASLADISGISGSKGDLIIDEVIQNTFVEINEKGIEAPAASHDAVTLKSVYRPPAKDFTADHPFIFYIKVQDIIIFAGRVMAPNKYM